MGVGVNGGVKVGVGVKGEVDLEPWVAEQRRLLGVEREAEVEEAIQTQVGRWGGLE